MKIEDLNNEELNNYDPYADADVIVWNENRKLQWEDYQGKPDPKSPFEALSNIIIYQKCDPKIINEPSKLEFELVNIKVYAFFRKSSSWVKPNATQNAHQGILLQHEQTHFNIEQVFSQKLAKKLHELATKKYPCEGSTLEEQEKNANELILKMIKKKDEKITDERNQFNNLYEKHTNYSKNIKEQARYNLLVSKMLKDM